MTKEIPARQFVETYMEKSVLQAESTPQGQQTLVPGIRPITARERLEAELTKSLAPRATQKPADLGLFDLDGRKQRDLF